eukprot:scaffold4698_cov115-Isochrysis_galbana.AAC.4
MRRGDVRTPRCIPGERGLRRPSQPGSGIGCPVRPTAARVREDDRAGWGSGGSADQCVRGMEAPV